MYEVLDIEDERLFMFAGAPHSTFEAAEAVHGAGWSSARNSSKRARSSPGMTTCCE